MYHCNNCDHDNEDLSEDEDGDLVCEECGHVIEPPTPEAKEGAGTVHTCLQCGEENHGLEPDEDGDLVCQECGHVIPEEQGDEEVRPKTLLVFSKLTGDLSRSLIICSFSIRTRNRREKFRTSVLIASTLLSIPSQMMKEIGSAKNAVAYYQRNIIATVRVADTKT